MLGKIQVLVLPALMASLFAATSICHAQCNSWGVAAGWPNAGCSGCSQQSTLEEAWQEWQKEFHEVVDRNTAWPLPFNCQDREAYYQIWAQQHAHGLQIAHTLTQDYFDPQTNQLNRAGRAKVSWIMQKAANRDKAIFLYQDSINEVMSARQANVRHIVNQWYSHMGNVNIAQSTLYPTQIPAIYQARTTEQYSTAQPAPVIPVATGSTITSSVGN